MKKLTFLSLLFMAVLLTLIPVNSLAASLKNLPSTQSSKQWEVVINKADHENPKLNQSAKPELYSLYSMDIKNGKENVELVRVEAYRDHPKSSKEYELFTADFEETGSSQSTFHHTNFPLSTKATKLKVIITWKEKSSSFNQRKYREQFIFEQ